MKHLIIRFRSIEQRASQTSRWTNQLRKPTLGTRGNSLAKSGRRNECEVRSWAKLPLVPRGSVNQFKSKKIYNGPIKHL